MNSLLRFMANLYYYLVGNIWILLIYDQKYVKGKLFKFGGNGYRYVCRSAPSQFFRRINAGVPWPVSSRMNVSGWRNINFDPDDMHIFQMSGVYFQALDAPITIGTGVWIAPNVGIITTNHDVNDLSHHAKGEAVTIGKNCWLGMNTIILPGVKIGNRTIVGAGSVVTKSFPEGNLIIAGNPARKIRGLDDKEHNN